LNCRQTDRHFIRRIQERKLSEKIIYNTMYMIPIILAFKTTQQHYKKKEVNKKEKKQQGIYLDQL